MLHTYLGGNYDAAGETQDRKLVLTDTWMNTLNMQSRINEKKLSVMVHACTTKDYCELVILA